MRMLLNLATLTVLTVSVPATAQLNNNDGTVISVKSGGPVKVVTAKRWACDSTDAKVKISGHIGQFVSEHFDESDRIDRVLKDFSIKAFPQIGGHSTLIYEALPVSGSLSGLFKFTFTWQSHVLKLTLMGWAPVSGTFNLLSQGKIVATGNCTFQSAAFKPPA